MEINEVKEQITELLEDNRKYLRFPTNALRKNFIKKLINIIENGVEIAKENIVNKTDVQKATTVLRDIPNITPVGSVVLTESMSQMADEMPKTSGRMIRHQVIK